MAKILLFALPNNEKLACSISSKLKLTMGEACIRAFPDGETYVRIKSNVKNKTIILVCTLDNPNQKFLPLFFMAKTLKELGAKKICLVAPYLSYMRQDKCFHPGEAVTSTYFAQLLSNCFDYMITIDPHLHRVSDLSKIYTIDKALTVHATQKIAEWIHQNVKTPLLVGPDEESRQWVEEIANISNMPFIIGEKQRLSDQEVIVTLPYFEDLGHVPVIVDDVISTGHSMIEVIKQLIADGMHRPICIGVHALFDSKIENKIIKSGAKEVITCNTILHSTNRIDIVDTIAKAIHDLMY